MIHRHLKLLYLLIALSILFSGCSRILIPGSYRTNFPAYGMFSTRIYLNCYGNATINFVGDLMNDNSYGWWSTVNDTLVIKFDTLIYPDSRYKDTKYYLIRGRRLIDIPLSNEKYNEIISDIESSQGKPVRKMSLKRLNRKINKAPINYRGRFRRQYFVRISKSECYN